MLTEIADGVLVHESAFLQSHAVAVLGAGGVLLIDPGIERSELATIANDVRELGKPVVAGFATHPHWDHVLWHPDLGDAPRYATAACAADIQALLASPGWRAQVAEVLPPESAGEIPMELFGLVTALPNDAPVVPWDGPAVRIIEHQAHAKGHAALLIEAAGVLVAGDMLSDTLIPFVDLEADDPTRDYLAALDLFEGLADRIAAFVPGHGSIGGAAAFAPRVALDRAYVLGLRDGGVANDPRLVSPAPHSEWLPGADEWQRQKLAGTSPG